MSLLQALETKAEHVLKKAKENFEKEQKELANSLALKMADLDKEYKHIIEAEIERKYQQGIFSFGQTFEFDLLRKKHDILDELYGEVLAELAKDKKFIKLFVEKFVSAIKSREKEKEAQIFVSGQYQDQADELLKDAIKIPVKKEKDDKKLLRLRFSDQDINIDFDLELMLEELEEKTLSKVSSQLF